MENLTETIKRTPALLKTCETILPGKCCTQVLGDLTLQQTASASCVKAATSRLLGYSIVAASSIVKLPQLLKLWSARSSAGLSFAAILLELLAITFNASYSYANRFPFSAWGEALFLLVETALIAFFVLWFDRKKTAALTFVTVYTVFFAVLLQLSAPTLWYFQALNVPLAVTGKLVQAKRNYGSKHTGQLSAATAVALFIGCVVRIFTSIQETGDRLVILTYAAASVANFLLVAQIFFYWNNTNEFLRRESRKKRQ
jgi:mannose-P-dolichol utilization defect protein 1